MPFSRFAQAARVAGQEQAEQEKNRLREAAFVGWQVAGAFGGGESFPSLGDYLQGMGLSPSRTTEKDSVEHGRRRAAQAMALAREADMKGRWAKA